MPYGDIQPCDCVWRLVFRECLKAYRYIQDNTFTSKVTWHKVTQVSDAGYTWGRPKQDFLADMLLTAKRWLSPLHLQIFRRFHLEGKPWTEVAPKLGLNRGELFHHVYRIESHLGWRFTELRPYALYPIDEYMSQPTVKAMPGMSAVGSKKEVDFRRNGNTGQWDKSFGALFLTPKFKEAA